MASKLFEELKRRRVFRATGVYLLVAWAILQLADIVVPALGLPEWVVTLVLAILVLCFPLAIVLAWIFDLTPHGLKRSDDESEMAPEHAAPAAGSGSTLRFGEFELDVPGRELRRDGEQVELQPRVFALLAYLAEHRDRAVSKDELQEKVWAGVVVTEASLTRAVMKLRQALGDDAGAPSAVKTIHGHGYRFVAAITGTGVPARPQAEAEPMAPGAVRGRTWIPLSIAALLVVAVVLGILSLIPRDVTGTRVAVLPVINATNDPDLVWARLGLMSFASGLIDGSDQLSVVSDAQIVRLAEEIGDDDALMAERLRRGFGATHILRLELTGGNGDLRLNYTLTDAAGSEVRGTMVDDDATVLTRGVARSVVAAIAGQRRMRDQFTHVSDDPFLNEAYSRGMSLALEGRCADARGLFKVVMDQEPESFDARFEYAYCSRILGEPDLAEEILVPLIEEQRPAGPNRALANALQLLGVVYNRTGRLDEAETLELEGLQIAKGIGDEDLAGGLLVNLSIIAEDRADFALAKERLGRAMVAYQDAGREVLPGQLYSALANLAMDRGELDDAEKNLALALESFRFVGDRRNEAMMLNNTGYLLRLQGRLDEAETFHQQSYALRNELGDRVGMGRVRNMMAQLYLARGQFDKALEAAEEAAAIASASKDRLFEGTAEMHLGEADLGMGNLDGADDHFRRARRIFDEIQDRMRVMSTDVSLARIEFERGSAGVEIDVRGLIADARQEKFSLVEIEGLELLGDMAAKTGDLAQAVQQYRAALALLEQLSWDSKETDISVKLAEIHVAEGSLEAAEPLVGLLSQRPNDLAGLRLRAHYAAARGDAVTAAGLMQQARSLGDSRWSDDDERDLALYLADSGPIPPGPNKGDP
jgi:DNA-binding winged helix-turn-helix (wHTH) protein/tetratricopeptide (TPR) repeat protein